MRGRHRADEGEGASAETGAWTQLLGMQGDIEATAIVVMMEAVTSAREDLKSIMAGVKAINAAKRHQRELMAQINRDVVAATLAEVEGAEIDFPPLGLGLGCGSGCRQVSVAIPDPEAVGGVRIAHVSLIDGQGTSNRRRGLLFS
ncbi:hypothetical protein [Nocardioides taihuensis]|uniref:DUF222 domain-containing protein n=1 Tax=Nocardioides taihuensis TaxID=1835606 RepID=A0ABW0BHR1_9ACTN